MDPLDFLTVARTLSGSDKESELRTSIGRSYYAVFNQLRLSLERIKPFPKDEEDHQRVVYYLTEAGNAGLKTVGQSLNNLRKTRNDADYDMTLTISSAETRVALLRADKAIATFKSVGDGLFKAAITAVPAYRPRRM